MSPAPSEAGLTRLPFLAGAFVALVCVAILALSGWREWASRETDLKNAEVEMTNLARSLTQHAEDTLELTDALLSGMVNRLETDGTSPAALARLQAFLEFRKPTLGRISGLFVYDETGRWLATSEKLNFTGLNNSDRDYFQRHRESSAPYTLIGKPVKSRSRGQWIITASRRFNHPDGSFAGVALATIDSAYFTLFYGHFDIGANGAISLLSADGTMLARSPDDGTFVGRDLSGAPLFRKARSLPSAGTYYFTSALDGVRRLSFYKRSDRYPLVVLATKAQDDVLMQWRHEAEARMAFILGLTLVIAVIGFHLVRQSIERHRMAAALLAQEADFRLLAEESSDIVMRVGADERLLYVSPSSSRILGWTPEQLIGTPALAGVHADDLPRVEQTVAALKRGEIEEAKLIYRTRHRGKDNIWLETAMRATRKSGTGEIDGVVAISRDMTEHKDLEEKLATLATSDGLTGLANRRHFDDRLLEEWERAKRDDTPLSLLLIDVDRFKNFNDQYGHQAGDSCLRSLAKILASEAQRPADLAARYGGEEFVLLLPNTDAGGCAQVGERIRTAVFELGIPHTSNHPSRRVTVSLGGAVGFPGTGGSMETLIEAADRALYAAKDGGRDRLVLSGQMMNWPYGRTA